MWIEKIILLEHPFGCVENKTERIHIKYPEGKICKTVLDTGHHVVEIVDEKIVKMMETAPLYQIIFDELTKAGVHYVGLYAYNHKNRLTAATPLQVSILQGAWTLIIIMLMILWQRR